MRAQAPSGLTRPRSARRTVCQLPPRMSTKAPSTMSVDAEDRLETARKNKEAAAKELEKKRDAVKEALVKLGTK